MRTSDFKSLASINDLEEESNEAVAEVMQDVVLEKCHAKGEMGSNPLLSPKSMISCILGRALVDEILCLLI